MSKFVDAYSKSTGEQRSIPAHWLELDMPPFNDYSLDPPKEAKATPAPAVPAIKKEAK